MNSDEYFFKGVALKSIIANDGTKTSVPGFTNIIKGTDSSNTYQIYGDNTLPFIVNNNSIFKNKIVSHNVYKVNGKYNVPDWCTGVKINIYGIKGSKGEDGTKGGDGKAGEVGAGGDAGDGYGGSACTYSKGGPFCIPDHFNYSVARPGGDGGAGGAGGAGGTGGKGGEGGEGGEGGQFFMKNTLILDYNTKAIDIQFDATNESVSALVGNLASMKVNKGIKGGAGAPTSAGLDGGKGHKGHKGGPQGGGNNCSHGNCGKYGDHGNHETAKGAAGAKGRTGDPGTSYGVGAKGSKGGKYTVTVTGNILSPNTGDNDTTETAAVEVYYFIL
jgi:hypothetical protein